MPAQKNKAVFLDRDGTINVEKHFLYEISGFEYIEGAVDGMKALSDMGFLLVVITNQSGIARGYYTEDDYLKLDKWMREDLMEKGVPIVATYYCPHLPNGKIERYAIDCDCRKPKTALYWRASEELNIDMDRSFAIGDKLRDLAICNESGTKGILLSDEPVSCEHVVCSSWKEAIAKISGLEEKIALYGLSTETERWINENDPGDSVAGLLDGFRSSGEMYGYPIIDLTEVLELGVKKIIVVARPGSCKAITKRIGGFCAENSISLFDVRGKDLLALNEVRYSFEGIAGYTRQDLHEKIKEVDVVSFDLFDTLITRSVLSYTDVFELVELRLAERGVTIPDLSSLRLRAEKELSVNAAPCLDEIYDFILNKTESEVMTASELSELEWNVDYSVMKPRYDMHEVFCQTVSSGKSVVITTDTYYSREKITAILDRFGFRGYDDILVSCECKRSKTQGLFEILKDRYSTSRILHIGDDEVADISGADSCGLGSFRVYSGSTLFDYAGEFGFSDIIGSLSDRIKVGMLISRLFNSPFCFENEDKTISVGSSSDIGYVFCAPMITDFAVWMNKTLEEQGYKQVLFCARDGYLLGKLFEELKYQGKQFYFLTSRTAAIRAGVETVEDIEYVDSMKYFGTASEATGVRFGVSVSEGGERNKDILARSKRLRDHYGKYVSSLGVNDKKIGMFDFVAKGTTQLYLQKLFSQHMKGFYFLQLEPEFMADKGVDIEPFYSEEEKDSSAIFDNYYVLETILTSPDPQLLEFDESGKPIYADETRSKKDIECFMRAHDGVLEFFEDYIGVLSTDNIEVNKNLDEALLALINKLKVTDTDFLDLKVEDPFFGRMTEMRDLLG